MLATPIALVLLYSLFYAERLSVAEGNPPYTEIFYKSGALRIQAYLYKPAGHGPFPLIVYNHGSRDGQERTEQPALFVARVFLPAGYAVLVPERRGYGKSEGKIFRQEVGSNLEQKLINRLQEETSDVLAGVDEVKNMPDIDTNRISIIGWSFGGIISLFAASRSDAFFAIVDQAGGSLTWNRSQALRLAMTSAARGIHIPLLCMDAENDATTESVNTICKSSSGNETELKIYSPFTPTQNPFGVAPGHLIFSGQVVSIWGRDVVGFINKYRPQ